MVKRLMTSLESRPDVYECNTSYCVAVVCDPRFKLRWCSTEDEKKKIISAIKKRWTISIVLTGVKTTVKGVESSLLQLKRRNF